MVCLFPGFYFKTALQDVLANEEDMLRMCLTEAKLRSSVPRESHNHVELLLESYLFQVRAIFLIS